MVDEHLVIEAHVPVHIFVVENMYKKYMDQNIITRIELHRHDMLQELWLKWKK